MFFPAWDMIVSSGVSLFMSNAWMPEFVAKRMHSKSSEEKLATSNRSKREETVQASSVVVVGYLNTTKALVAPTSE